jgi:hypothetical protein
MVSERIAQDDASDLAEEAEDQFPAPGGEEEGHGAPIQVMFDNMEMIRNSARRPPSIHASELASTVGSTVMGGRDAFLKSITFWKKEGQDNNLVDEMDWAINFLDPNDENSVASNALPVDSRKRKPKDWLKKAILGREPTKSRIYIDTVGGVLTLSRLQFGDYLKSVNGKSVKDLEQEGEITQDGSLAGVTAYKYMETCIERDGYLSIVTENKESGDDILIQATVIKPRPNMRFKDMGIEVWHWGYLCIRHIDKGSIFEPTVLRSNDHIVSVNNINCSELRPDAFATVMDRLGSSDITITVLRRKQRWGGKFS